MGVARLGGHVQAALSATACWNVTQGRLFYWSWKALGADLLYILPGRPGHDVVNVRSLETIKGGGSSNSVGTHVLKHQPVPHLEVRQGTLLHDPI